MIQSVKHLDFIIEHAGKTIKHYNKANVKRVQFFYLGLCERLQAGAKGLKTLLTTMENQNERELEFSAGLVVRTMLLDFLIGLRGYDIFNTGRDTGKARVDTEAELTDYCNSVLADGVTHTFKHLTHFKNEGAITQDQLNEAFRTMAQKYQAFVEPYHEDGNPPAAKFKPAPKVLQLFKMLSSGGPELKELAKNYDTYSFYSKYEHFNIMSYDLMRRYTVEQDHTLKNSINLLVLHAFISCQVMEAFAPDDFLKEQIKSAGEYISHEILKLPSEAKA
jgi:hypothetical protein